MLRRAVTSKVGLVRWMLGALAAVALMPSAGRAQAQFTVGTAGNYTDIQTAVNACPKNGCDIILIDSVYKIPREIWIEGYINLTIRRSPDLERRNIRPRLFFGNSTTQANLWTNFAGTAANPTDPEMPLGWKSWPINDGTGVGGAKNTANQWSTSGFQHIGYIVVQKSDYVTLDGLKIDGLKPTYLLNKSIWPETAGGAGKYAVFFGNVGVNLMQAHKVNLTNSEIVNCFTAVYMNGRNPGGAFGAENPGDLDGSKIIPYAAFGRVGDHTIERNTFANNWWAFFDESEWDLGSTIRYNISYNNYNPSYGTIKGLDTEGANMFGGFMYIKDVVLVPHKIYNNTLYQNAMVLGYGGWRGGIQHYFYNNIVANPRYEIGTENVWNDFRNLMQKYSTFLYNNTFEFPASWGGTQKVSLELKGPDSVLQGAGSKFWCNQAWCSVNDATISKTVFNNIQVNGWTLEKARNTNPGTWVTLPYDGRIDTFRVQQQEFSDSLGLVLAVQRIPTGVDSIRSHQNHFVIGLPFKSTTYGSPTFMEPMWDTRKVDSVVEDRGWVNSGRDPDGSLVDRGAIPRSKGVAKNAIVIHDQTMVSIVNNTTVKFNFGIDAPGLTDLRWEKLDYYQYVSYVMRGGTAGKPTDLPDKSFPAPLKMTVTSGLPQDGQNSFTATLPVAPSDSFARFEITVSGIPVGGTERVVSNIGVWVWRKADYALDVRFLDPTTLAPVTAVRVGQPVKMQVRVLKTADGTYPTGAALDSLIVSLGSIMIEGMPGASVDTVKSGELFDPKLPTGQKTYDVFFTRVEAARTIDLNFRGSYGAKPVIGSASLRIRSGPPEKALFVTPNRLSANRVAPVVVNQTPAQFEVELRDAFDNPVDDTAVTVELNSNIGKVTPLPAWVGGINPVLGGVVARWGNTAIGPWTEPAGTSRTDSIGYSVAMPYHYVTGQKGARYLVTANVFGKTFMDTAWIEVGDPLEQIYIAPAVSFDTLVTTRMPVKVILSKDGLTPLASSPFAGGTVRLSSRSGSKYLNYFASALASDTAKIDSVVLVAGEATVWVTVLDMPMTRLEDTLTAEMTELFAPTPGLSGKIAFNRPPSPPNPIIDVAITRDGNCDGLADTLVITLKSPAPGVPGKLTPNTIVDSIRIAVGGVTQSFASGWTVPVGDSSMIRFLVPSTLAATIEGASVGLHFILRNPPLADTLVSTGLTVIADGIGPRLIGSAILTENFGRPTTPDTLQVSFSEPVQFSTASGWNFALYNGGTLVPSTGITVTNVIPVVGGNTYKVVFTGNNGVAVAGGYTARLLPSALLTDAAGNLAGGSECLPGVPVVEQPSPVPVSAVWLKDESGDGTADRVYIRYVKPASRLVRVVDLPDSIAVSWGSQTLSIPRSALLTLDSITWEAPVGPFAYGVTVGSTPDGSGSALGSRTGVPLWSASVIDSVSPIPVRANLTYAPASDLLVVSFSEKVKSVPVNGEWLNWKSGNGAEQALRPNGVPTTVDSITWTFPLDPGSVLNPNPGDSVRLPLGSSRLVAANNGTQPSTTAASPFVLVVGGDRPPTLAWYSDLDADGIVDAAGMVFGSPLKTSPTFKFRVGSEEKSIDSTNGLVIAADRRSATVSFAASPFGSVITTFAAADSLGTMSSQMGTEPALVSRFPIQDSVAPVILAAKMRYSDDPQASGAADTLKLFLSEPVVLSGLKSNVVWGMKPATQRRLNHLDRTVAVSSTEIWVFFPANGSSDNPGNGDSVRLAPKDLGGEIADILGNAPTAVLAKWTPVQAGQRPPQFDVAIYPSPLLVVDPAQPDPMGLRNGPQVTTWFRSVGDSTWTELVNGVAGSRTVSGDGFAGLTVGPKFDINGTFDATALIYDNIGTFVASQDIHIDSSLIVANGLSKGSGSFQVFVSWNGLDAAGKTTASGVFMFRVVAYQDVVNEDTGVKGRKMLMNKVSKVGVRIPSPK